MSTTIQNLLDKHKEPVILERPARFANLKQLATILNISHHQMGKVIQIAGTNGKGSTQRVLWQLLKASGKSCHLVISPHVEKINERIRINDEIITDDAFLKALKAVDAATAEPLGYYIYMMFTALYLFSRIPTDYVLLETGLGGQFDTTNILEDHVMSIITPIGLDHCDLLGDSIEEIAYAKACIQRPGRPCVVAPQKPEVMQVIQQKSEQLGSHLIQVNEQNFQIHDNYFVLDGQQYNKPSLEGDFQMTNAAVAIKAYLTVIDEPSRLSTVQINQVLSKLYFPGRLHQLPEGKLTTQINMPLWLDGAHNPHAARALIPFLKKQNRPIYLWCRFKANKDAQGFLSLLKPWISKLIYQDDDTNDIAAREFITAITNNLDLPIHITNTYQDATDYLNQLTPGLTLACGSLYWVGDILNYNDL